MIHTTQTGEAQKELAETFEMKCVSDLKEFRYVQDKIAKIPYLFAKQQGILPVDEKEGIVQVAVDDPLNLSAIDELRLLLDQEVEILFCPKRVLEEAIELCYRQKEDETKRLFSDLKQTSGSKEESDVTEGYDLLEKNEKSPVIQMLDAILIEALQQGASDIHFEPQEKGFQVRYRIDGILLERHSPPREYQTQILTRIKVMARLDIAEHRLPQDGRIKLKMGGREIDFRVSTIPVVYGERIVLRILDKNQVLFGFPHLGMKEELLQDFKKLIELPEGIILVTGPTGSGKTTTLYSAISEIASSEINVMTIEDPVEYKLSHIAQIGVNPKIHLTFAAGLRHILRQDPDVILIGEIRDAETAEIAIQAALTGHLVFSTLHTNDAPSAIVRLAEMGIEPYLLSSSLIGVLAQRLVRKICPFCKEAYNPSEEELEKLQISLKQFKKGVFFRGKGCPKCLGTGYKGRIGIYELMRVTSLIKKQIMNSVDGDPLRTVAISEGMTDLFQNGKKLLLEGITTSEEVFRVTKAT